MKKLLLCIPVLLMQGCSGAASQPADIHMKEDRYEIEQGAQLDIYLPDEGLSCALEALWNKTYPAYRNALHFSQEDKSLQTHDLVWGKDTDAWNETAHAYPLTGIKQHLEYEEKRQERAASDYAKLHSCEFCSASKLYSCTGYDCREPYRRAYEYALSRMGERQET